jgi:GT2 family glycosyltransferase
LSRVSASVVLFHGDPAWTLRCVAGLVAQDPTPQRIRIHCNDDDGSEASAIVARLAAQGLAASCVVTSSRENLGFAGGHNRALEAELVTGGMDAVLIVNADLVLLDGALAAMLERVDAQNGRALVGPVLHLADESGRSEGLLDTTGIVWSSSGRHFDDNQCEPVRRAPVVAREVSGISGACLLVPWRAYARVVAHSGEFFDELFLAYREDAELGFRAGLLGIPSIVEPRAVGLHARGTRGTDRSGATLVNLLGVQNRFLTAFKYGRSRPGGRVQPWLRDAIVIAAVLLHERSSLPGLRRAFRLRSEERAKGRRVLNASSGIDTR